MNTNEAIHNRNAETAPRLRFNNDPIIQNHIVYPYTYPMHQLFYPISQPVIMTTNHSQVPSIVATDQSNEQSGIMSPSSDTSVNQPPYRISTWQDIVDNYEGNEEKPKCGKLKDNVYFTQRSASSDMYMLFDRKSDYINNFVNYYFSDKNLARDQKLVALMDDKGVVPLSALARFPKLHQIDTTVEDLIKAFQHNHFVAAVDMQSSDKGAQRRDKLCQADVANRNGTDKSGFPEAGSDASSNSDVHMTLASVSDTGTVVGVGTHQQHQQQQHHQQQQQQNQSYYVYNQAALLPTLYSPQAGIMPASPALGAAMPSYNPYIMANFPYAAAAAAAAAANAGGTVAAQLAGHQSQQQQPMQQQQQSQQPMQQQTVGSGTVVGATGAHALYPGGSLVWPVAATASSVADYGGHAALLSQLQQQQQPMQQQQYNTAGGSHHHSNSGGVNNARFLSNGGVFNPATATQTVAGPTAAAATAGSVASEPTVAASTAGNRMN